jgi:hypothetical protein
MYESASSAPVYAIPNAGETDGCPFTVASLGDHWAARCPLHRYAGGRLRRELYASAEYDAHRQRRERRGDRSPYRYHRSPINQDDLRRNAFDPGYRLKAEPAGAWRRCLRRDASVTMPILERGSSVDQPTRKPYSND